MQNNRPSTSPLESSLNDSKGKTTLKNQRFDTFKALFVGFMPIWLKGVSRDGQGRRVKDVRGHYPRPPVSLEIERHLYADDPDGIGAIGARPGYKDPFTGKWVVSWIALDVDGVQAAELGQLTAWLLEQGLKPYLTRGTTGRGAHLWLLLSRPMPKHRAHQAAQVIASKALQLGYPRPELFPSSAWEVGNGIFYPYRGGFKDGLGFNPLLDPETLHPIPLEHLFPNLDLEILAILSADDVAALAHFNQPEALERLIPPAQPRKTSRPPATPVDGRANFRDEIKRIQPFYQADNRQNLILGLAAYALMRCGLPQGAVAEELKPLLEADDQGELPRRLRGIENTYRRHNSGEKIAIDGWYEKAGAHKPTRLGKASPEALATMRAFTPTNPTDRLVHAAFIGFVERFGYPAKTPETLCVSLTTRELAQRAGVSEKAARNYLQRHSIRNQGGNSSLAGIKILNLGAFNTARPPDLPAEPEHQGGVKNAYKPPHALTQKVLKGLADGLPLKKLLKPHHRPAQRRILTELRAQWEHLSQQLPPERVAHVQIEIQAALEFHAAKIKAKTNALRNRFKAGFWRLVESARRHSIKPIAPQSSTPLLPYRLALLPWRESPPPPANGPPDLEPTTTAPPTKSHSEPRGES